MTRFSSFLEADEVFLLSEGNEVMFHLELDEVFVLLEGLRGFVLLGS